MLSVPSPRARQWRIPFNSCMLILDRQPEPELWDSYVRESGHGLFSHIYGWGECLAKTYDLPLYRLAVRDDRDGHIRGILPLMLFAPPAGVSRLISLPYSDAAGILCDSPAAAEALQTEALAMARELQAKHLELRQAAAGYPVHPAMFAKEKRYVPHGFKTGLARKLPAAAESLWRTLSAKVRNQVRKARACGCVAQLGGVELLDDFYQVFSENMRDLGSPVHARELFSGMLRHFKEQSRIITVSLNGTPAAAAMVFRTGSTLFNPWASSLRIFRPQCPNMLLYWTMLEHGCSSGCSVFDFGRSSPGASTCRFKLQWGAEMQPLTWHVFSLADCPWDPLSETLEHSWWKDLSLEESRCSGPGLRRWISL